MDLGEDEGEKGRNEGHRGEGRRLSDASGPYVRSGSGSGTAVAETERTTLVARGSKTLFAHFPSRPLTQLASIPFSVLLFEQ